MAENNEVVIHLTLDDKASEKLTQALSNIDNSAKKTGTSFVNLAAQFYLVEKAINAIKGPVQALANSFMEQEDATQRLSNAMKIQGTYTDDLADRYARMAKTLQASSRYGDEAIQRLMQQLISVGNVGPDMMERAARAAMDFAAATGRDLSTAALTVGKAMSGFTGELSRYGIILDDTIPKSEKATQALAAMERQFGGMATGDVKTLSGMFDQLKNAWDDIVETIGTEAFTKFKNDLQAIIRFFKMNTDAANEFKNAIDFVGKALGVAYEFFKAFAIVTFQLFVDVGNNIRNAVMAFKTGVLTLATTASEAMFQITRAGYALNLVSDEKLAQATENLQLLKDATIASAQETNTLLSEENGNFIGRTLETYRVLEQEKATIKQEALAEDLASEQAASEVKAQMSQQEYDARKNMYQQLLALNGQITGSISSSFSAILTGAKSAKDAFAELGQQMIKIIVDFVVQQVVAMTIGKALQAAAVAIASASAASLAMMWAPAATLASIATMGSAAAVGTAAIGSALATSQGMTGASLASAQAFGATGGIPKMAEGGIVSRPTLAMIGEAGPEAIIPLNKGGGMIGGDMNIIINGNIEKDTIPALAEAIGFQMEREMRFVRGA
jgi:hypothetical protein